MQAFLVIAFSKQGSTFQRLQVCLKVVLFSLTFMIHILLSSSILIVITVFIVNIIHINITVVWTWSVCFRKPSIGIGFTNGIGDFSLYAYRSLFFKNLLLLGYQSSSRCRWSSTSHKVCFIDRQVLTRKREVCMQSSGLGPGSSQGRPGLLEVKIYDGWGRLKKGFSSLTIFCWMLTTLRIGPETVNILVKYLI